MHITLSDSDPLVAFLIDTIKHFLISRQENNNDISIGTNGTIGIDDRKKIHISIFLPPLLPTDTLSPQALKSTHTKPSTSKRKP